MSAPTPKHDFDRDPIDVRYRRIVRWLRAAELLLHLGENLFIVLAGIIFGGLAGALAGSVFSNFHPAAAAVAACAGAAAGGWAGVSFARREYREDRERLRAAADEAETSPALYAPHLPGLQEQFARARRREFALFLLCIACSPVLGYLAAAPPDAPLPAGVSRMQAGFLAAGFWFLAVVLLILNSRCPACRSRTGTMLMKLRKCPSCGVAFRD